MRGLGGTGGTTHLAGAVGALEGLLLEEHREAMLRSHLLEDLARGGAGGGR